jgi:hypothetical protein
MKGGARRFSASQPKSLVQVPDKFIRLKLISGARGAGVRGSNLIPDDSCPGGERRIARSLPQVLPNPLLCGSLIVCFHIIEKGATSPEIRARHDFLIAHGIYVHFLRFRLRRRIEVGVLYLPHDLLGSCVCSCY